MGAAIDLRRAISTPWANSLPRTMEDRLRHRELDIRDFFVDRKPNYDPVLDQGDDDQSRIVAALEAARDEAIASDTGRCVLRWTRGNYFIENPLQVTRDLGEGPEIVDGGGAVVYNGTMVEFDHGATLYRGFTTPTSDWFGGATLRNEHCPTFADLAVDPGPFVIPTWNENIGIRCKGHSGFAAATRALADVAANDTYCGPHITMFGVNDFLGDHIVCRGAAHQSSIMHWCNKSRWSQPDIESEDYIFSVGLWMLAGADCVGVGGIINSGEDAFAHGSSLNLPLDGFDWTGCKVNAQFGHAFHIVQQRVGSVVSGYGAPTQFVRNIRARGIWGKAGQKSNGCIRIGEVNGAATNLVTDVDIEAFLEMGKLVASGGSHNGTNAHAYLAYGGDRVTIRGGVTNPIKHGYYNPGTEVVGKWNVLAEIGKPQETTWRAYHATTQTHLVVGGRAGSGTPGVGFFDDIGLVEFVSWNPYDIPNSGEAAELDGTTKAIFRGCRPERVSGATLARFVQNVSTATDIAFGAGNDVSGIDVPCVMTAVPARFQSERFLGAPKQKTISTGAVAWQGETDLQLLSEGSPATDILNAFTAGVEGAQVRVRSAEADPVTNTISCTNGTGANAIDLATAGNANYVLNQKYKGIVGEFRAALDGTMAFRVTGRF